MYNFLSIDLRFNSTTTVESINFLADWANEQQDSSDYEGVEAIELAITAQRRS